MQMHYSCLARGLQSHSRAHTHTHTHTHSVLARPARPRKTPAPPCPPRSRPCRARHAADRRLSPVPHETPLPWRRSSVAPRRAPQSATASSGVSRRSTLPGTTATAPHPGEVEPRREVGVLRPPGQRQQVVGVHPPLGIVAHQHARQASIDRQVTIHDSSIFVGSSHRG